MYFVKIRLFVFTTFVNGWTLTCFQCLKQKLLNWCKLAVEFFPAFKGLTLILSPEKKEGRSRKGGRRGMRKRGNGEGHSVPTLADALFMQTIKVRTISYDECAPLQ